ncbi:MAG: hypothetical protein ACJASU_001641 [Cognaticolwellia sp.]|jgi:hypothetical protein
MILQHQQREAKVESLNGKVFAILLNCICYESSTPDAHKISNQCLLWLNKRNYIALVSIYSQRIYAEIVKNEQAALVEFKSRRELTDVQEAKHGLISQLQCARLLAQYSQCYIFTNGIAFPRYNHLANLIGVIQTVFILGFSVLFLPLVFQLFLLLVDV